MNNLSKEEKLELEIRRMSEESDYKKWMRCKKTFFVLCGIIAAISLYLWLKNGGPSSINISGFADIGHLLLTLIGIIFSIALMAGLVMTVAIGIMIYIVNGALKDEKAIAKKMGELEAIKFRKYE